MDAIHHSNALKWKLFTVMARSEHGKWEYIMKDIYDEPDGPSKYMLNVREVLNKIKAKFYKLEPGTADWADIVRERISA